MTPLDFSEDHGNRLMASFHPKTRNMVRKAEKVGVEISVENEMLDFVHENSRAEHAGDWWNCQG